MSTHAFRHAERGEVERSVLASHWTWLLGGLALAFAVPYVLADVLELNRDLYYGVYVVFVVALVLAWARETRYDLRGAVRRHWLSALMLGLLAGAALALVVLRSEDATTRPDGAELVGTVLWRGVVYGLADGVLLSAFPILAVFAALAGWRLNRRVMGTLAVGAAALVASLAFTTVYHAGYSDFRSEKLAKPVTGDVVWSIPTLVTLNPIGSPIAHASMHTSAVLHSYETETFLPPHR